MVKSPDSNPKNLLALIKDVADGKVVVPEFQRSFVWKKNDIEEFLTSLLCGYFIGTFLMLDTPSKKPMFPFRLVEGVKKVNPQVSSRDLGTVQLVLDGQQRITSLFYAFHEPEIPLKGVKSSYKFYLDIKEAISGDLLDEAVIGVPKNDSRQISEMEARSSKDETIPFSVLCEPRMFYEWIYQKQKAWQGAELDKILDLYKHLEQFMVPVITLPSETSKDDIVNIFERINRTGVGLSLFDLAVAQLYPKDINLRGLWDDFRRGYRTDEAIQPIFPLRVIALIQGKEIRKRDLLSAIDNLEATNFLSLWEDGLSCLESAHKRIVDHYGAFSEKWIPYTSLIITLSVLLYNLKKRSAGANDYSKVDQWYWACVLSRRYDRNTFTKTYEDIREIENWSTSNDSPKWIDQFTSHGINFDTIDDSKSSLYKGIIGLIVCKGSKDFLTGQPARLSECQDDHIFPKSKYRTHEKVNSILNKTLIWEKTNKQKKNRNPSEFFEECLSKHGGSKERLSQTLASHFISAEAHEAIKRDDFDSFLEARKRAIEEGIMEKFK